MKKKDREKNEIGYEEKNGAKPKTNLQNNVQERSHLEGEEINFLIAKSKLHQTVKPKTPT